MKPDTRGTTVLEFVVALGVISSVLVTAVLFSAEMLRAQAKSMALAEAVRNARFAMSRMEIEAREATAINTGSSTFDTNPSTLSLATASGGTNPTIFAVSGGALTVQQGAGAATPLTNGRVVVEEFTASDVSVAGKTAAVRLHLKVRAANPDTLSEQTASTTIDTTVRLRAHDGFSN